MSRVLGLNGVQDKSSTSSPIRMRCGWLEKRVDRFLSAYRKLGPASEEIKR
jgi:hypothetical protein